MPSFFGKYRGKVSNNIDPIRIGRIQVIVPSVLGQNTVWAMPSMPYAGKGVGFYAIPPLNANVWVEFEAGDPDLPIWSGCFWGTNELPTEVSTPDNKVFKTENVTVKLDDTPGAGGLLVDIKPPAVASPVKLSCNTNGIELHLAPDMSVRIKPKEIVIGNGTNASVTIQSQEIKIQQNTIAITLTPTGIELNSNPAIIKLLTAAGIELANAPGAIKLTRAGVELNSAAAIAKLTPAGIDLSNAGASIKLSSASVNINNGALEVT